MKNCKSAERPAESTACLCWS